MYASEVDELLHLLGRRVRVRNGKHTFVGILRSGSQRKFPRGKNRYASGLVLDGQGYRFEFAWWDWHVSPADGTSDMNAAGRSSFPRRAFSPGTLGGRWFARSASDGIGRPGPGVERGVPEPAVSEAMLYRANAAPFRGEREATDVPQDVLAGLEAALGLNRTPLDQAVAHRPAKSPEPDFS